MSLFLVGLMIFGVSRLLNYFFSVEGFLISNNIFFLLSLSLIIYPFSMGKGYKINSKFVKYNITSYELIIMIVFFSILLIYRNHLIMFIFLIISYLSYRRKI